MYLRDARHLDKMMFTLVDRVFYLPFEIYYNAKDEYTSVVEELIKEVGGSWVGRREGFWFHVYPEGYPMPSQGWKIHVSATLWNGATVLRRAASVALASGIAFKFAVDRYVLSMMSSKRWHRGGSGKFITMYPPDRKTFRVLLERLYVELHDEEGPYVLSDKRYKDCKVLYYRYGGMARTTEVDITGEQTLVILAPDGKAVPDIRTPYFSVPEWESDPFPSENSESGELTLNQGRYRMKRALAFSNSGGVYVAEDQTSGREVVIKEARARTQSWTTAATTR